MEEVIEVLISKQEVKRSVHLFALNVNLKDNKVTILIEIYHII